MSSEFTIKPIAYIYTDFPEKFGIPRQAGLVDELKGKIVFEPEYRFREALKELNDFSHIWLIWQFSECIGSEFSPTVRPPRLGGNKRVGVFASRSPFRPNSLGLSCVKIDKIDFECENAPVLYVSGIDMLNKTPIFDIKPYIPVADLKSNASEGYTEFTKNHKIKVEYNVDMLNIIPEEKRKALLKLLENDPRPSYIDDGSRKYGLCFAGFNIKFTCKDNVLIITEIERLK